jgi:hypothetical protein
MAAGVSIVVFSGCNAFDPLLEEHSLPAMSPNPYSEVGEPPLISITAAKRHIVWQANIALHHGTW